MQATAMMNSPLGPAQITLPSDKEIRVVRDFAAPRALVFDAWTKPEWLRRWFGCDGQIVTLCEDELRVGGAFRRVVEGAPGTEGTPYGGRHVFSGEYSVFDRPARLVSIQRYENIPDTDHEVIVTFEDVSAGGAPRTRMTMTFVHRSTTNRDGHLGSGMEYGLNNSFGRLDAALRDQTAS
jgi:uncharacterized protein YndB with AHSA1/START domain